MSVTTIGSRAARQKWRDLLDAAHNGTTDTIIERNGKPIAVLIPYEDYLAIQEALDDLRAARRVADTYEVLKQNPELGRAYGEIRASLDAEAEDDD